MLIKEISPITSAQVKLTEQKSAFNIIDEVVELPLRKACKIFNTLGIETVMSSANQTNVLKADEKPKEKADVYNPEKFLEKHTFYEAGFGYAWIMLNFNSLSNANKDLLFNLETKLGQNKIWFVHPAEMDSNIEFCLKTGKYDYNFLRQAIPEEDIPKNIEIDEKLIEFEKRHIVLLYPWENSSTEAVFLRMPINDKTTVQEVEQYFVNFAKCFHNQTKTNEKNLKKLK